MFVMVYPCSSIRSPAHQNYVLHQKRRQLIKYIQNVYFLYSSLSISGSFTVTFLHVIPWHFLHGEEQFNLALLQEQVFPHGPLEPQCTN